MKLAPVGMNCFTQWQHELKCHEKNTPEKLRALACLYAETVPSLCDGRWLLLDALTLLGQGVLNDSFEFGECVHLGAFVVFPDHLRDGYFIFETASGYEAGDF